MTTIEVDLRCPFCGDAHDRTTLATPEVDQDSPRDGDVSACSSCGTFSIFDSTAPGGLRAPTGVEIDSLGGARFELLQKVLRDTLAEGRKLQ